MYIIRDSFVAFPILADIILIVMLLLFRVEKKMPQIRKELDERSADASNPQ